jgi:hypothetical protein
MVILCALQAAAIKLLDGLRLDREKDRGRGVAAIDEQIAHRRLADLRGDRSSSTAGKHRIALTTLQMSPWNVAACGVTQRDTLWNRKKGGRCLAPGSRLQGFSPALSPEPDPPTRASQGQEHEAS